MAVHGTMISSLPPACRQAGACRGIGALRSFAVTYRMRAHEHQRAVAVREAADDACAVSKLQGGEIVSTFRIRSELSSSPIL